MVGSCSPWKGPQPTLGEAALHGTGCSPHWCLTSLSCQGWAFGCAWGRGRAHRNIDCDQVERLAFKITVSFKYHKSQFTALKVLILFVKRTMFNLVGLHWIYFFLLLVCSWTSPPGVHDHPPRFIGTFSFHHAKIHITSNANSSLSPSVLHAPTTRIV